MQSIIDSLNWRYAVKKYDDTRQITQDQLRTLREAVRLTPTSAGLQPFRLIVVQDPAMKEKLAEASLFNKPQVRDAGHLFVFAAQKTIREEHVAEYIDLIAATRSVARDSLAGFEQSMKGYLLSQTPEETFVSTSKQSYIGLGVLLSAAATMRVDATPMEGFDRDAYDQLLGLENHSVAVICTVGHRSESDAFQHLKKVRRPEEEFFSIH